uniref:Receptor expression-enhancing protein n=1 Tax=Fopius arisanus TaxID=64838 RepID=A0A0C9RBP4_9HYME
MISSIISRLVILVFGTLYPAYASYKAVRTKNVKEYVKWMMYWIVFALFTCAETFTDVFFSFWFPFYYEIKIILVLWLLSPATKGSSILYRRFVHPALIRREAEIDDALARATEQGYTAVLHLGTKGVNYATTVLMQTAIKNLPNALLNPQSTSPPESQSEPAVSSLVNQLSPKKSKTKKDSVEGITGRSQSDSTKDTTDSPVIVVEPSSDDDGHDDFVFKEEDSPTVEEFKEPEKPPKQRRITRRRAPVSPRDGRLRCYDPDYSDGTDA